MENILTERINRFDSSLRNGAAFGTSSGKASFDQLLADCVNQEEQNRNHGEGENC